MRLKDMHFYKFKYLLTELFINTSHISSNNDKSSSITSDSINNLIEKIIL